MLRNLRRGGMLEQLEPRMMLTAVPSVIVDGGGTSGVVTLIDPHAGYALQSPAAEYAAGKHGWMPFGTGFHGGINAAMGDIDGDGVADVVVAPASHGVPLVQVYNSQTGALERNFFAYVPTFLGGVNVAVGDVNGDGKADIITAPASGGAPLVNVFDGATGKLIRSFYAYETNFTGGVSVAAADVNGDGHADIVTGAGYGGGPRVRVFSGANGAVLKDFYAFDPSFRGGVVVAAGDMEGNGHADVVAGVGFGAAGNIRIFSGADGSLRHEIVSGVTTGVSLVLSDFDYDGHPDLLWGWKNTDSFMTGGGVYKGSTFAYLADWGINASEKPTGSVAVMFEGSIGEAAKDRYTAWVRASVTDFPTFMGSLGITVSEVADLGYGAYGFTVHGISADDLHVLAEQLGAVDVDPDWLITLD